MINVETKVLRFKSHHLAEIFFLDLKKRSLIRIIKKCENCILIHYKSIKKHFTFLFFEISKETSS